MRETVGSPPLSNSEFTTQMLSNAATMPIGSPPTATRATTSSSGGPEGVTDGVTDGVADAPPPPA